MNRPRVKDYTNSGLIVSGYADDIVFVDGDLNAEFYPERLVPDDAKCECLFIAFSDGTLLRFCYDEDGIWRFKAEYQGRLLREKIVGGIETGTNDIVIFSPGMKWCVLGPMVAGV